MVVEVVLEVEEELVVVVVVLEVVEVAEVKDGAKEVVSCLV